MSTESLAVEQRVPVVVRFAYSQVVRNGWSKQNCTSYLISHGFNRFALHHITASGEEDDQPNLLIYLIDPITDPNIVRTQITEGPNSIIKNLYHKEEKRCTTLILCIFGIFGKDLVNRTFLID